MGLDSFPLMADLPVLGGYFSPVKVAFFVLLGLGWAATAAWVDRDTVRVKVSKSNDGASLPGYTYTQESQDF